MAATHKSAKKRSAPSQSGPKPKKVHLEKENTKSDKKRSRPITKPVVAQSSGSDSESDSENGLDEADGAFDETDDFDVGEGAEQEMEVDQKPETKVKDPNGIYPCCWICMNNRLINQLTAARESHKAQKALQEQRRASKPHSSLLASAKKVWSLARQKNIPTSERQKHVKELMDVIRGKVSDIVFKHDASRIVQTAVKYGGQKERDEIASELKGRYRELAQNKYSKVRFTYLSLIWKKVSYSRFFHSSW